MATNFHQPSVLALYDAMPVPMITFGVNGVATYANRAARIHPDKPVEAMSGRVVIKNLAQAITLGKVKLPFQTEVGVSEGHKMKGVFMAGPSGLDIAFVAALPEAEVAHAGPGIQSRMGLEQIIELLQDEVGPPMRKLTGLLSKLPESDEGTQLELAANDVRERLHRLADLLAVFGEEAMLMDDRMDLGALVAQTVEDLKPKALQSKVRFEVRAPPCPPFMATRGSSSGPCTSALTTPSPTPAARCVPVWIAPYKSATPSPASMCLSVCATRAPLPPRTKALKPATSLPPAAPPTPTAGWACRW